MERSLLNGQPVYRHLSLSEQFYRFNLADTHNKKIFFSRLFFTFTLAAFAIINAFTAVILSDTKTDCMYDALHNSTSSINSYFQNHALERSIMLIISSLLIDILLLTFAIRFATIGTTWRPIVWLVMFYMSRCVTQVRDI